MSTPLQTSLFADLVLPRPKPVFEAVNALADESGVEERGAVFTAREVVEAILDLCEYTPDRALANLRLLEPSFGRGDFLVPVVRRLLASLERIDLDPRDDIQRLRDCIRGVELHRATFLETRRVLEGLLHSAGLAEEAEGLLSAWLVNDDFLLAERLGTFDVVVGNPPYVRQERVPAPLLRLYRERFETFVHRADLYVPFYEKGLDLLQPGGWLGFICANRWVRNQYGAALREKVGRGFHLKYFIDLERAAAFQASVIAYPAITVLQRAPAGPTLLSVGGRDSTAGLPAIVRDLRSAAEGDEPATDILAVDVVTPGPDPWLLECPTVVQHLRDLEARLPSLEEAGARVGIGVATGADRVFIGRFEDLPVEPDRKLPLAMASDCREGGVDWGGMGVVNPYLDDGQLAPLDEFPKFAAYLHSHRDALERRHTAQRQPHRWYKTIDRIYPALTATAKLLIPDIKGDATVSLDEGRYYPHHNLYVVTSPRWDLLALQSVLRSSLALAFVAAYSPKMSGGFLRFQAQYLRRIRCPRWEDIQEEDRERLAGVTDSPVTECDDAVFSALRLSKAAADAIRRFAESVRVRGAGA
ncbi:MAG: Eco57I restriction-modification methylase domain-containing protein [Longimicrobiales bacterium]